MGMTQNVSPKPIISPFHRVDKLNSAISHIHQPHRKRGSVLLLATIFTAVLSVMVVSLLKYAVTEMRLNKSAINYLEASNAAESIAEYGFAQLQSRWESQTNFNSNELRTSPLSFPSTAEAFYAGTHVIYDDLELIGGTVPPGEWVYLDPSDPSNQSDPLAGRRVFQRDVEVYAKGVSDDPLVGRREAYCAQVLSVRDTPLFTHAIFYNMDLEFHPGPRMEMEGPVHSNGDIYVQAIDRLRFHSTLMAFGDIYHGYKQTGGTHTQTGEVLIKNSIGDWVDIYKSGSKTDDSSYVDSRLGEDWRIAATERWSGNVGSDAHGVPKLNPIGVGDYVPDDPNTVANEKVNSAFAVIEPQVSTSHDNYKGDDVRSEQLSYKAGLVFKVDRVADASEPGGYRYDLSAISYQREDAKDPKSDPRVGPDGSLRTQDLQLDKVEDKVGKPILTVQKYAEDASGNPTSGFYDRRQLVGLDVVDLDMSVLADMINNGEGKTGVDDPWNGKYHLNPGSAVDWNGVVYVELPYDDSTSARSDKVMPANRNVALRIVNGDTVPNPSFSKATGYDEGFTLATNGQLYVKGHFNSDGVSATGSSTETDDGKTTDSTEAPVALYADSITILSNAFDDSKTKQSATNRKATFTEVSAALVTGLLPTVPGSSEFSGGAHNLPRFLEDWDNVEFRYRGSLVALFESEAGNEPMDGSNSAWYKPPNRNWGYNDLFAAGIYPPGTPNARDFRRTNFHYLTASEYEDALSKLDGFDAESSTRGH